MCLNDDLYISIYTYLGRQSCRFFFAISEFHITLVLLLLPWYNMYYDHCHLDILSGKYLSIYLSIYISIYPSIYLSIHPSIHPSIPEYNIYIYIYIHINNIYILLLYIINIYLFIIYLHVYI